MEITIGMLVGREENQIKYRKKILGLLQYEPVKVDFQFYLSLEQLYENMLRGSARVDILVLSAGIKNFEFAKELRISDRNCLILYPARDMSLALQAFESMPMAYIPAQGSTAACSLENAIFKAVDYIRKIKREIVFETKSAFLRYSLYEIDYFESQYRLVHIVSRSKKTETITARLDEVQNRMPESFYRCHQSFLVNMDNISFIDKSNREVHFVSGQCVPSSKKLFTGFLNAYREYREGGAGNAGIS